MVWVGSFAGSQLRRVSCGAVAAEEAQPVRLVVDRVGLAVLDDEEVRRPHLRLLGSVPPAGGDQRPVLTEVLRVHEQLGEGRMGEVVSGRTENQLVVAGDRDGARSPAVVADRQPSHHDVGLR